MNRFEGSLWLAVAAFSAIAVGCGGSDTGAGGAGGSGAPTEEMSVVSAFGQFQKVGFTRITKDPVPSQHALSPKVVVWVNDAAAAAYRAIDPANLTATAGPFPVGTIIIKQGIGADGNPDGNATVAAKFKAGFNPTAADWWWGRFDPKGALAEKGPIQYCIDCHKGNGLDRTDWMKGTASTNQMP